MFIKPAFFVKSKLRAVHHLAHSTLSDRILKFPAVVFVESLVPKTGLKTAFRDGLLRHVAQDVVKLAKDGLERRGFKESGFLNEVAEVVRTGNSFGIYNLYHSMWWSEIRDNVMAGVTPAEKLLELYHGKWCQSVDPVFEELLY
ncbi:glutamate--cysteine ligase, chloroplastic-like [Tripterygium wilfordii]|uniref:glutamate--cysteine ligase, chloroplastic-like n=1 Tax=Tripterygium wilfordii TaxID=458696 RepID=UPI0018F7EB8E|nr:glutamate--cysteine ligase, chloroplastic-like [Tripterygium wilfordii]